MRATLVHAPHWAIFLIDPMSQMILRKLQDYTRKLLIRRYQTGMLRGDWRR